MRTATDKKSSLAFATLAFSLIFLATGNAFAAGYTCVSVDNDTRVDINSQNPDGSLPAKNLVILDPTFSAAKQETADFETQDRLLWSETYSNGIRLIATVDLNVPGSSRAGRRVGGTTLGSLERIVFEIETITAAHPVPMFVDGAVYAGEATYVKSNGETLKQDFDCRLFLGNQPPALDAE